ncbi:hypothetical protein D5086_033947 [Populus alba]|uniref:Uncharacterized protein n=1 Tax=Populus alba TaxID=43335 RepID=A0ACC4AIC1_POPAL
MNIPSSAIINVDGDQNLYHGSSFELHFLVEASFATQNNGHMTDKLDFPMASCDQHISVPSTTCTAMCFSSRPHGNPMLIFTRAL